MVIIHVLNDSSSAADRSFADAVCQRLEGREEQFIGVVSTLAKAYADCVAQDYQVFMEHFLATDTAS